MLLGRTTSRRWQEWIAYFREAGFDCIDVNLDYANRSEVKAEAQDILADGEWVDLCAHSQFNKPKSVLTPCTM